MVKLNMGCGEDKREGYINIDNRESCKPDMVYDLEKTPYPFEDESVEEILWKDSLEHLSWRVIEDVLKECYRILKPNGVMYIQTPDLEIIAKKIILDPNFKYGDLEGYKAIGFWVYGRQDPQPDGSFGGWGGFHKAGFTKQTLKQLLESVGFKIEEIKNDDGSNIICWVRK